MLKIRSTSFTFLSLHNLEAAPEEAMQLRRLIKSSNESLGPYLLSSGIFRNPELRYQDGVCTNNPAPYSTSKSQHLIGLTSLIDSSGKSVEFYLISFYYCGSLINVCSSLR